jgi:hypothetical protein
MNLEAFPQFPSYRQIALSDRQPIQVLFDRFPMGVSERTFGSVFVWRNYERRAELSVLDDHLIISWYKPKFGRVILPPVGQERVEILEALVSPGMKDGHDFYGAFGLLEPDVSNLRSKGKSCESLRDEWDYVYRTKDLIELDGPKYHTQRKELKKATSQLELVFEPMTKAHKQACLELEETWCDMKHCTFDKFSHAEDLALREALANFDELGFLGGVVLADGKVQALTCTSRRPTPRLGGSISSSISSSASTRSRITSSSTGNRMWASLGCAARRRATILITSSRSMSRCSDDGPVNWYQPAFLEL